MQSAICSDIVLSSKYPIIIHSCWGIVHMRCKYVQNARNKLAQQQLFLHYYSTWSWLKPFRWRNFFFRLLPFFGLRWMLCIQSLRDFVCICVSASNAFTLEALPTNWTKTTNTINEKNERWKGKDANERTSGRKAAFLCKCLQITFINYYDSLAIWCVSEWFPTPLVATFFFSHLALNTSKRVRIIIFINNSHQPTASPVLSTSTLFSRKVKRFDSSICFILFRMPTTDFFSSLFFIVYKICFNHRETVGTLNSWKPTK